MPLLFTSYRRDISEQTCPNLHIIFSSSSKQVCLQGIHRASTLASPLKSTIHLNELCLTLCCVQWPVKLATSSLKVMSKLTRGLIKRFILVPQSSPASIETKTCKLTWRLWSKPLCKGPKKEATNTPATLPHPTHSDPHNRFLLLSFAPSPPTQSPCRPYQRSADGTLNSLFYSRPLKMNKSRMQSTKNDTIII